MIILTSIYPLQYMAERIGGGAVTVHSLIPPGGDAHHYEPSPGDLRLLGKADLLLLNGLGMEPWAERALASMGASAPPTTVALYGSAATVEDRDPHVWLVPRQAAIQAMTVAQALMRVDPDRQEEYAARAQELTAELESLDAEFEQALTSCARQTFVATHAAYGHLAARYGLEQLSVTGLLSEAEPAARHLAELADLMKDLGIRHILVEPALSDRNAQIIVRESGAEVAVIHQIGSVTLEELAEHGDYMGLMRDNLTSLQIVLECTA